MTTRAPRLVGRRLLSVVLCLASAAAFAGCARPVARAVSAVAAPLDVMTFNVRYAHTQPPDLWPDRLPVITDLIERTRPDIIGTQEGLYQQIRDLESSLPGYAWIGTGRDGETRGEFMAVFYRRDRLEALAHENYWLSDTPGIAGSRTWGNNSTEHQQRFHQSSFSQMRARDYMVGTAVWNQFDFGSKGRHDSKPNINQKGLFYLDRTPNDIWHYYRAVLRREPVLHIATRDWLLRASSSAADARQPAVVFSNLPQVELFANGVSLGAQRTENAAATWLVPFHGGTNRLEARGGNGVVDVVDVRYDDRSALFSAAGGSTRLIAVNAGSHYQYVDNSSTVWEADRPYGQGGWGYVGGETRLRHHRIHGSDDDPLYQIGHHRTPGCSDRPADDQRHHAARTLRT